MAQKTRITLVDDLDGSEATRSITFAYQGVDYEIDLNDDHAVALEESFHDWIEAARKTTSSRTSQRRAASPRVSTGRDLNKVRVWLRENGHEVADRGRVKADLLDAYDRAH